MNKKGINNCTLIPLRKEPFETSEMTSQIIFGETFDILDIQQNWSYVELHFDGYRGWVDKKLIRYINEEQQEIIKNATKRISEKLISTARISNKDGLIYILAGSVLYNLNDNKFKIADEEYELTYPLSGRISASIETVVVSALQMLNIPYLWGGISSFGIDCSGLVQTTYKIAGIKLPRDTTEQVKIGKPVDSLVLSKPADLVFFENNEGRIIHTGILLTSGKIIHASGKVRVDSIDYQGIYNSDTNNYTHKLKTIRRIIE
jgi:gamma-D-glutamyl-L-lysine dipeptidyl-peptidase